jgi:glucosylceramidase
MRLLTAALIAVLAVTCITALKACIKKNNPGSVPRIECVCNSTYCDEFPPLGDLNAGEAAIYQSSISGKRFDRTTGKFSSVKKNLTPNTKSSKTITATFDTTKKYQKIIGFGGAFTDAASINLAKLSAGAQEQFIQTYYGDSGIQYTTGRVPVASCDFSTREYSYADTAGDFNMTTFALAEEDFKYKIPFIKRAREVSKNKLKLFSTPWAPPGWMKTNGEMRGQGTLKGDIGGEYYQSFALYYYKFFEAYHNQGIDFWGLTVLNEPFSGGDWQLMRFNATQETAFVKKNLGPILRDNDITKNLKLMIYDDQRDKILPYINELLGDPEAAKFVDGIAIHWYLDNDYKPTVLSQVHNAHPGPFILPTEACTYYAQPMAGDWSRGLQYSYDIMGDLQNWATGWTDWNLAVNTQGGPNWVGNYVDAPIIVSNTSDEFYKQPMFYAMGHFSKFLQPDSQRVDLTSNAATTDFFEGVGFVTPDNKNVVVFDNRQATDTYTIALKDKQTGKTLTFNMEPRSLATIVWNQ